MTTTCTRKIGIIALGVLGLLALGVSIRSAGARRATAPPDETARLEGGAESIDALAHELLAALAARDQVALRALRVSEREYLDLILPGNVEPGQPPQHMPSEKAGYYWNILDGKSRYFELKLLDEFGGRSVAVTGVAFQRGQQRLAWFTAHRQMRLTLRTPEGEERELRTGSVAEVNGRFKFVSFVRD